jgi:hypothetical protein
MDTQNAIAITVRNSMIKEPENGRFRNDIQAEFPGEDNNSINPDAASDACLTGVAKTGRLSAF